MSNQCCAFSKAIFLSFTHLIIKIRSASIRSQIGSWMHIMSNVHRKTLTLHPKPLDDTREAAHLVVELVVAGIGIGRSAVAVLSCGISAWAASANAASAKVPHPPRGALTPT